MSLTLIILLILVGLLCLLLEVLVIPGSTVVGILGFSALGVAIWQAYSVYGSTAGHIVLGSTIVLAVLTVWLAFRSGTWKRMSVKTVLDGKVNVIDTDKLKVGDTGLSISRLAPAGKAQFEDEMVEVQTYGDFIDQQREIEIIEISDHKIFVKLKS